MVQSSRRPADPLASLLLARRNITIATPGGCVLVLTTEHLVTLHFFGAGGVRSEPVRTVHLLLCQRPDLKALYGWQTGWDLSRLQALITELSNVGDLAQTDRPDIEKNGETYMQEYSKTRRMSPEQRVRHRRRLERVRADLRKKLDRQPPYAPLLCEAIRAIAPHMPDSAFKTFVVLASHANPYGCAFPGIRGLEAVTGHNLHQVRDELDYLETVGLMRYIRRHMHDPYTGHKLPDVIQISPALLYIRQELREAAMAFSPQPFASIKFPHKTSLNDEECTRFKNRGNLNHNHQEAIPIKQRYSTNASNHHHQSQFHPRNEDGERTALDYANQDRAVGAPARSANPESALTIQPGGQPGHKPARSANPAPNGARPAPGSAPPPPNRARYEVPLSDAAAEALAHEVRQIAPTRLWQARELVDAHDANEIRAGLLHLARARQKGSTREPFGLLKWWLQQRIMRTEQGAPDMVVEPLESQDPNRYVSGKYAAFIKH